MGTIQIGYIDRVKYVLFCEQLGYEIVIIEPIGWNNDDKEFARNTDYDGIVAKFSNSLKFIGDGAEYINLAFSLYDVMANIKLTKYERHPKTDKWTRSYWGFLDLMTRKVEDKQVSVKFNSGGLQEDIKSREDESVEVDRVTTISGLSIDPIVERDLSLTGRRIFLKSKWEVKDPKDKKTVFLTNYSNGNTRGSTYPVPMTFVYQSHENASQPIEGTRIGDNSWDRTGIGETGNMFFLVSDSDRSLNIKLNLSFNVKITQFDDVNHFKFYVRLATYKNESDFILKENRFLLERNTFSTVNLQTFNIVFNDTIEVLQGESLALCFDQNADLGGNFSRGHLDLIIKDIVCSLEVNEDSHFDPSIAKCYLAHDLLNQLTTICANKNKVFYSDYFGRTDLGYTENGPGAYVAMTHGFAVRGFTKLPIPDPDNGVENLYKPMTTSLRDAFVSLKAVLNVGVGIEELNGKERVRVEEMSFFYNNNVTIKLPNQVKNVKRSTATDYYWPSIEVGYESGYENEEAQGLDEPNGKSNFTTFINKGKNTFSQLSKYIGGMYAMEFTRRKPQSKFPTEDTKHDNDLFLVDLKPSYGSLFEQRKWQDDLEKEPTGIFSPETATNLRFSPFNMLLRHGWVLASSLTKFATEKIRYGSSTANSQLKTQLIGGNEYAENGDVINSEIGKARFKSEWIEFEHECTFDIMQQVQGTTKINGKEIQNFYGTVQFLNEYNKIEKGFLFNLKPNDKGQWKLLKSNR